jgi:hypothetical protein
MRETNFSGPGLDGRKRAVRGPARWAYFPLYLSFVLPLATHENAFAQDFHPTMVETGLVSADGHVAFNPAFRIPQQSFFLSRASWMPHPDALRR